MGISVLELLEQSASRQKFSGSTRMTASDSPGINHYSGRSPIFYVGHIYEFFHMLKLRFDAKPGSLAPGIGSCIIRLPQSLAKLGPAAANAKRSWRPCNAQWRLPQVGR